MKRIEFIIWAGKQGWKHGQKYLNKAYNYFYDKGKIPDPKVMWQKAKEYTSPRFLADKAKTKITPKKITPKTTIKDLQIGPHIDKGGRLWPKFVAPKPKGSAKIIQFPKRPPGKADGGRIDKALPTQSRDI